MKNQRLKDPPPSNRTRGRGRVILPSEILPAAGNLIPVKRNGIWVERTTGKPVKDQAYWNRSNP